MRELMSENSLSLPLLESDRANNSFMTMLLFHHFLSPEDLTWLKSFESHNLNEEEMKAMISAREVGAINNSTYRDINRHVDTLTASKQLKKLCDCGLLDKKGRGSATYYVITSQALENWPIAPTADVSTSKPRELDGKPRELDGKPRELDGKPRELDKRQSGELGGKPGDLVPPELSKILNALGGKSKPGAILDAIVALLKWKDLSISEIAGFVGRNQEYVRSNYMADLLRGDLVQLTIPDKPTDPNQKYRYKKPSKSQ
jgi:ATP-dependent DNA helicase RecG